MRITQTRTRNFTAACVTQNHTLLGYEPPVTWTRPPPPHITPRPEMPWDIFLAFVLWLSHHIYDDPINNPLGGGFGTPKGVGGHYGHTTRTMHHTAKLKPSNEWCPTRDVNTTVIVFYPWKWEKQKIQSPSFLQIKSYHDKTGQRFQWLTWGIAAQKIRNWNPL